MELLTEDCVVKLNVGGKKFWTTKTTLLRSNKNSIFYPMLSGKFGNKKDGDGFILIERDGAIFDILLKWLRNPEKIDNRFDYYTEYQFEELLNEIDFYQLNDFRKIVEEIMQEQIKISSNLSYQIIEEYEGLLKTHKQKEGEIYFELAKSLEKNKFFKEAFGFYEKSALQYKCMKALAELFIMYWEHGPYRPFINQNLKRAYTLWCIIEENIEYFQNNEEKNPNFSLILGMYAITNNSTPKNTIEHCNEYSIYCRFHHPERYVKDHPEEVKKSILHFEKAVDKGKYLGYLFLDFLDSKTYDYRNRQRAGLNSIYFQKMAEVGYKQELYKWMRWKPVESKEFGLSKEEAYQESLEFFLNEEKEYGKTDYLSFYIYLILDEKNEDLRLYYLVEAADLGNLRAYNILHAEYEKFCRGKSSDIEKLPNKEKYKERKNDDFMVFYNILDTFFHYFYCN